MRRRILAPATAATALAVLVGVGLLIPASGTATSDRTRLLYPFLTNQAGFDTAFSISNTTADPFGTAPQAGACTLTFFGQTPPSPITTPQIAAGGTYIALASSVAPGFQGYMFADCGFPLAHGFGLVSDVGVRNLATSYLALVVDQKRHTPEGLDN